MPRPSPPYPPEIPQQLVEPVRAESIKLRTHWIFAVRDQYTRRFIVFAVIAGYIDGAALCCLFNAAISKQDLRKRISKDNDPLFQYNQWEANLRVLAIEEIKSLPQVPMSLPFVERLIGSLRRELLN